MNFIEVLSYVGGYYTSTEFELDIVKLADVAELSEDEVLNELQELQSNGDISIDDNTIKLINIPVKTNKAFNDLYHA